MKWWNKMTKTITEPKKTKELMKWQQRYETAKTKYGEELSQMKIRNGYYEGTRDTKVNANIGDGFSPKKASNVRNMTYELIESQVDASVPSPKVIPVHEEDKEIATMIEQFLASEMKRLLAEEINDVQERTTYVQGSSFTLVGWDNAKGYHSNIGDLEIEDVAPDEIIPQPGVTDISKMDYIFIRKSETRDYVKRKWGVDVSKEEETDKEIRNDGVATEDIVTVVSCYYRNEKGGIGLYRFVGDTELESYEDYQARHQLVCAECGKPKSDKEVCECGSKKFVRDTDDMETITLYSETTEGVDEFGIPMLMQTETEVSLPYYKPNEYPIVMRKNVSRAKHFLGKSDIDVICDQQDAIKKYTTQIDEKLLMGGSFITLPEDLAVETTDEQLKIVRVNQSNAGLIHVITAQADTGQDRVMLESNYEWARSALGITDAFQGKHDASARSGSAKQFSINQSAGRLQSKRVMKNNAYARLYELMFKFALAYADQPIPIQGDGLNGSRQFNTFDKTMFVKQDSAGEWYWNDEFIFDIDATSTLMTNRESMWQQADLKLQSGAYGPIGDLETNYLYWLEQERNGFPHAGEVKNEIVRRLERQQQIAEQQQMMAAQMPPMQ